MLLRVASYNIHRAIGRDGQQSPERIAEVLREVQADVVALQEVAYRTDAVGDVPGYLAAATEAEVIRGETLRDERGPYGNAVLSRAPVARIDRLDFSTRGREPRGAIDLDLRLGDVTAQVLATHLGLRPRERRYQISRLLASVDASRADVQIVVGDFNELLRWGRPLRALERTFGRIPAPPTFPSGRPWLALDRVWAKPAQVLRNVRAHRSTVARMASDHLPLVAELDLRALPRRQASL